MKLNRRRYQSFLGELLPYQESHQIEPEILDGMVAKLREGDSDMIEPIIMGHLKMVMGIVADSRRSKRLQADIEGAAFLALVEAVNVCCPHTDKKGKFHPSRLIDNNVTFYITAIVKWAIKEEFSRDHVVCMPRRTICYKLANGEKFEDFVPSCGTLISQDIVRDDDGGNGEGVGGGNDFQNSRQAGGFVMPFFVPIAKPEFPDLAFTEILNRSIENEMERAIVKLRSEDCTYEEVGAKVGMHFTRVGQIVRKIEERFDIHNK